MGSHKNTLLQRLALLGLVSSVGIAAASNVTGQDLSVGSAPYEAMVEEARTLSEMIAANPESPAAQRALLRLQALLAQMPPAVRVSVITQLAATVALPPQMLAQLVQTLPEVQLASVTPDITPYG
ncbi:MAG: hypothetical protein MUF73_00545 [Rhodobacteraceae bacterium]|jgi:hypothetical protein|nr:hypothetical protein [Paracoccaceae bacterium]